MSFSLLRRALAERTRHVSPFLVLGDPTPDLSVALAAAAVRAGATMLELGFPYGDPSADGVAIQAADLRALAGGTSTGTALRILARIREACPETPLNLLVYGNLVHARGYEHFCVSAVDAGASSLLVPDIPLEESAALRRACARAGLGHAQLIGPLTPPGRLSRIARAADAFLYLVSTQGVTGVRDGPFDELPALVRRTAQAERPLCVGFGLSRPDELRAAFAAGARIAVVGSHLARLIGEAWSAGRRGRDRDGLVLETFTEALRPLAAVAGAGNEGDGRCS